MFGLTGSATAKVNDTRLILSMPDAETPVVWMLDLNDAATSVLRLESDKQGFYVIKKHGGKGAPETVAVYRNRRPALRALNQATSAMNKARSLNRTGRSRFINTLIVILFVWFAISRFWDMDRDIMRYTLMSLFMDDIPVSALAPIDNGAPSSVLPGGAVTADPNAVGVPLSADDFLKMQAENPPAGMQ